jgi:DNA polymerase III delta subunit
MVPFFSRKSVARRQHQSYKLSSWAKSMKSTFERLFNQKKTQKHGSHHQINNAIRLLMKLFGQIKGALPYQDVLYIKEVLQLLGILLWVLCRMSLLLWIIVQLLA